MSPAFAISALQNLQVAFPRCLARLAGTDVSSRRTHFPLDTRNVTPDIPAP
jgi:hypothetical protein